MDCFQVTRLRRIAKRRFNELANQARERLPLDLTPPRGSGPKVHLTAAGLTSSCHQTLDLARRELLAGAN
jgi:hypothetical protein